MAIATTHNALGNFRLDLRPGESADHLSNAFALVGEMVELEHNGIALAAIDARMCREIAPDSVLIDGSSSRAICLDPLLLMFRISEIPSSLRDGHAGAAPREPLTSLSVLEVEFLDRLRHTALRASSRRDRASI